MINFTIDLKLNLQGNPSLLAALGFCIRYAARNFLLTSEPRWLSIKFFTIGGGYEFCLAKRANTCIQGCNPQLYGRQGFTFFHPLLPACMAAQEIS